MTADNQFEHALEWCPPGRRAHVADVDIHVGGFWLGSGAEPSAVDPRLPVDLYSPDWSGHTVTVLRYDRLSPSARGAYLTWLATGRRAPQAPSSWAALYLLGLERRIVLDGDQDPTLVAEARALESTYGSVDPALARLAAGLDQPPGDLPLPALLQTPVSSSIPTELVVELGRRALAGVSVTTEWALAWAWYHPGLALQDAARRVPDEFVRLWRHRFDERYPLGLSVPPRRRRLVLDYEPANPTLPRPIERTVSSASDVFDHPGPEHALRAITDAVEQELAPYARWVSRNPHGGSAGAAAALLPDPLLDGSAARTTVEPLVEWATGRLVQGGPALTAGCDLMATWTGDRDRAGVLAMIRVLERHGVGIEPDVRFGGRPISDDGDPVVLFRAGPDTPSTPSPAYVLAAVTTELCLAVAGADGTVDDAEAALLVDRIDRIDDLTTGERVRLAAHRLLVGEQRIDLDEVRTRAGSLPEASRRDLAETVVEIALADGVIGDDERRIVRAVRELLGIEPVEERDEGPVPGPADPATWSGPHPRPAEGPGPRADSGPRTGAPAEPEKPETDAAPTVGHPPARPAGPAGEPAATAVAVRVMALDEDRLARTQSSNADVRELLGAIFGDDEPEERDPVVAAPTAGPVEGRIGSLDDRHSRLLNELAVAGSWSRQELESVCARLAVLPDGALDVINEVSYDLVDDPVIELMDDGSVVVDTGVLEEMRV